MPDFLSGAMCAAITAYAVQSHKWESALWPWDQRSINLENLDHHMRDVFLTLWPKVRNQLCDYWGVNKQLYGDIFQLVRWQPGDCLQPPHADAEQTDGSIHPFAYREFAAIIYLNQEYTGGQLYFPHFNLEPILSTGTLAIFPGTLKYLHGVTPIESGTRYTIAGFFTSQSAHGNQYLI